MAKGTYRLDKKKIAMLALDKGWSLHRLSVEAGIAETVFYKSPSSYPSTAKKLADALGVSVMEIIK